jgi:hypothetical protein
MTTVVVAAVAALCRTPDLIRESRLAEGLGAATQRWHAVTDLLRNGRPGPVPSNPSTILLPFFDYVGRCTDRNDRLLYAWYSPEVYVVADRAFAGDHRKFFAPFHSSRWEQARTIARLDQQRVPFVIVPSDRRTSFEKGYPDVWSYLQQRYVLMTRIPIDATSSFDVFRNAFWSSNGVDEATGWPCAGTRASGRHS